jgi:hypothetical protein
MDSPYSPRVRPFRPPASGLREVRRPDRCRVYDNTRNARGTHRTPKRDQGVFTETNDNPKRLCATADHDTIIASVSQLVATAVLPVYVAILLVTMMLTLTPSQCDAQPSPAVITSAEAKNLTERVLQSLEIRSDQARS